MDCHRKLFFVLQIIFCRTIWVLKNADYSFNLGVMVIYETTDVSCIWHQCPQPHIQPAHAVWGGQPRDKKDAGAGGGGDDRRGGTQAHTGQEAPDGCEDHSIPALLFCLMKLFKFK